MLDKMKADFPGLLAGDEVPANATLGHTSKMPALLGELLSNDFTDVHRKIEAEFPGVLAAVRARFGHCPKK